jgi:hypothetical protein
MLNASRVLTNSRIQPVRYPDLARKIAVRLPGGINYPAGQVLGERSSGTAADEVQTVTITGTPTGGSFVLGVPLDVNAISRTAAIAHNATAAVVQAQLERFLGVGNVTVSLASAVYTVTFLGDYARSAVPLLVIVSAAFTGGTTPAVAVARTTVGTPGIGMWAAYDDTLSDGTQVARAVLEHNVITDFGGRMLLEYPVDGGPQTFPAYVKGTFLASELTGLDANGAADLGKLVQGAAFNTAGAVIEIGV